MADITAGFVATTGAIHTQATTATAPTDQNSALANTAIDHGLTDSAGFTTSQTRNTSSVYAWQGSTKVRDITTESSISGKVNLITLSDDNLALYYGITKDTDGSYTIDPGVAYPRRSWIIDADDEGHTTRKRDYYYSGEVVSVDDQQYYAGGIVVLGLTVQFYKPAGQNGVGKTWVGPITDGE